MAPILMIIAIIAYVLLVVFAISPALDRNNAIQQKQNDAQAQECRDHGGVPIMSEWDGSLKDCKVIKKEN